MGCGEGDHHQRPFQPRNEQECHNAYPYTSVDYRTRQCQSEWDNVTGLCWPNTIAGTTASVPCPDKPGLNILHSACRECLKNGTWMFTYHLQGENQAIINYDDCFLFEEKEFRLRLARQIGNDTLLIHDILRDPGILQFCLQGFSLLSIGASFFIWFFIWFCRTQQFNNNRNNNNVNNVVTNNNGKYKSMLISCAASFSLQIIYVSHYGLDDDVNISTCCLFRILHTFFESILYACVMFYVLNIAMYISAVHLSTHVRRFCLLICSSAILAAAILEGWIEIVRPPYNICIFGLYLNPFHWIILGFKISLIGGTFTLICVSMYGLFYLRIAKVLNPKRVKIIKIHMLLLLIWIMTCFVWLFTPIFLYYMQGLDYSMDDIVYGTRVYGNLTASNGIGFAVLTCFLDVEILATVFPGVQKYIDSRNHWPIIRINVTRVGTNNYNIIKNEQKRSNEFISNTTSYK